MRGETNPKVAPRQLLMVQETMWGYTGEAERLEERRRVLLALVPVEQVANMEAALKGKKGQSYRDGVIIQLAYKISDPTLDATKRPSGGRTLAQRLALFFEQQHIPTVRDAYQNIAKNSAELCRGNFEEWDRFLPWLNEASGAQLEACFDYACALVASQARPRPPMPELDGAKLDFRRVMGLFAVLLSQGSQGVFEQYAIASLLDAQLAASGSRFRVGTKNVNVADASASAAGDIEIVDGNRVLEAIEVTAADWRLKIAPAVRKLREHDLSRIHIVAPLDGAGYSQVVRELAGHEEDVSVVDLRSAIALLLASLRRSDRKMALRRLYEYLDRYGAHVDLITRYVDLLTSCGLVFADSQEDG